jgi:hypothetical protein
VSNKVDLGGYVDVPTRMAEFRRKHPEGSLQPADLSEPYKIERINDQTYIVVVAAAYRGPDDTKPGIGMAYEPFPGRTPYTRGSELQNAETSAWGRAIAATLAVDTKKGGVASAEEIRNRNADEEDRERVKAEEPQMTKMELIKHLRSACFDLWKKRGGDAAGMADEYAQWSSSPQDPKGRDIGTESDPAVLAEFQRYLQKQGAS